MEEKAEGSEMRHIRINTGVVDVWLVECEVLKCPPQAYAAGSTGKRESEVFYSVMILDGQARMGAQRHATWSRCDPHTRSRRRGETRQEVKKVCQTLDADARFSVRDSVRDVLRGQGLLT